MVFILNDKIECLMRHEQQLRVHVVLILSLQFKAETQTCPSIYSQILRELVTLRTCPKKIVVFIKCSPFEAYILLIYSSLCV